MDVADWLRSLGLERYITVFNENDITFSVLPDLSLEDLKELGVISVGHRRQLQSAIAALSEVTSEFVRSNDLSTKSADELKPVEVIREVERRQITVMFCDLVGVTELSTKVDPEDLRDFLNLYRQTVDALIESHAGFVAQYLGDGVLVYFGYPEAHENDAESAIRAGLAVVAAVAGLPTVVGVRPQVRIGVATGLVVVGNLLGKGAAREHGVGETPNLASRIQSLAPPSGLLIAENTRKLVGNLFEYRPLEPVVLKGFSDPILLWEVLREGDSPDRFAALRPVQTPLVGREEESALLLRRWTQARSGEGRVVLLSGEPGIGKSRLVAALREQASADPNYCLQYFCAPHMSESVLFPILGQLEHAAGLRRIDDPGTKIAKLREMFERSSERPFDDAILIGELLGIPPPADQASRGLSPLKVKELVLERIGAQLDGLARHRSLLMIFEDAHWLDPTSLELLDATVRRLETLPILLVVTHRLEFAAPWQGLSHVTVMTLARLGRRDNAELIRGLSGGRQMPQELTDRIVARADGVPLFVEELTRSVLESGLLDEKGGGHALNEPLPELAIPTSLQASLASRLDRLSPIRNVAHLGAALGREFSFALICAVSDLPRNNLRDALDQLVTAELLYQRGAFPDSVYTFKHALVQDAAYETLLRSQRIVIHARIVAALERQFPETVVRHPDLLAHHATQAAIWQKAIDFRRLAALTALSRSATTEASGQIKKALALLPKVGSLDERHALEYRLQIVSADIFKMLKGFTAPELGETLTLLSDHPGRRPHDADDFKVSCGLWSYYFVGAKLPNAIVLAQQLMTDNKGSDRQTLCHFMLGVVMAFSGRLEGSVHHLSHMIENCSTTSFSSYAFTTGYKIEALAYCWLGMSCLGLGRLDQAKLALNKGLEVARAANHPFTLAVALANASRVFMMLADVDAVAAAADEGLAISRDQKFPYFSARCAFDLAWVDTMRGLDADGLGGMTTAIATMHAAGARMYDAYVTPLVASALLRGGHAELALAKVNEALANIARSNEFSWAPEAWRIKGEIELKVGDTGAAVTSFRRAIDLATEQGALFWHRRASLYLAEVINR